MMNFVCIKWGDKYPAKYVNNLYNMVKRNFTGQFTFTCYTDDPVGIECDTTEIPDEDGILHPKYYHGKENYCFDRAKFLVFNSQEWLMHRGNWCYFDLDVVIQDNIDEIEILSERPRIIHSRWQPENQIHDRFFIETRGTFFNSSMMLWPENSCAKIYYDVLMNPEEVFKTFFKGTDNYHYWRQKDFWKNIPYDWVYSWNRGKQYPNDLEQYKFRPEAKICLFNVDNVPHPSAKQQIKLLECTDENIVELWK